MLRKHMRGGKPHMRNVRKAWPETPTVTPGNRGTAGVAAPYGFSAVTAGTPGARGGLGRGPVAHRSRREAGGPAFPRVPAAAAGGNTAQLRGAIAELQEWLRRTDAPRSRRRTRTAQQLLQFRD